MTCFGINCVSYDECVFHCSLSLMNIYSKAPTLAHSTYRFTIKYKVNSSLSEVPVAFARKSQNPAFLTFETSSFPKDEPAGHIKDNLTIIEEKLDDFQTRGGNINHGQFEATNMKYDFIRQMQCHS